MLGRSLASSLLAFDSSTRLSFSVPDLTTGAHLKVNDTFPSNVRRRWWTSHSSPRKWVIHSTLQIDNTTLGEEDSKIWEASRVALSAFDFSSEEKDKILAKAFGHVNSPYWSEERKQEVPKPEIITEILNYLGTLGLSSEDLYKVLKKFPEVLGCNLEHELQNNVKILEKDWGIEGKSLRNLLLRNPKVLGYNVDCKGDCMAKCTRCWVRF